jgi:hypothetical protein
MAMVNPNAAREILEGVALSRWVLLGMEGGKHVGGLFAGLTSDGMVKLLSCEDGVSESRAPLADIAEITLGPVPPGQEGNGDGGS